MATSQLAPAHRPGSVDQDGQSLATDPHAEVWWHWAAYFSLGVLLGTVFVTSYVLSWYRIQEMFRFQSFYMYGVIGTALIVAAGTRAALARIDRYAARAVAQPKTWTSWGTRYWLGGTFFGMGWALIGACPGPLFTLLGAGYSEFAVPMVSALLGTYTYGAVRHRLPH